MRFTLWIWILSLASACGASPLPVFPMREAMEAWVELRPGPGTGVLARLELVSPSGQVEWGLDASAGAPGSAPGARLRLPIVPFGWRTFRVEWLPEQDGPVTLTLTTPRELATNQMPWRQEAVFDDLRVTGTLLTNASFEHYVGNRPVAWEGGGVVNAGPLPPFHEANYARVWCERPLRQTLHVRSNVPVTLQLAARSLPLLVGDVMRPLADRNTLAWQAFAYYHRGMNVMRFLELPPNDPRRLACTEEDFARMKREGFDHVRLPVAWHLHAGPAPDYQLHPAFLRQVDQVISNAFQQGLFVILPWRVPDGFSSQPAAHSNQWLAVWRQLARHYAEAHPGLAWELLDEVRPLAPTPWLNGLYTEALKLIRQHNPMRTVFLGPGRGKNPEELPHLRLPPDEENVIVTVACLEPRYFTWQSQSDEAGEWQSLKGVVYPGPPSAPQSLPDGANPALRQWWEAYQRRPAPHNPSSRAVVENALQLARDWSNFYGHPAHVAAFGASAEADTLSRARYVRDVRQLAESWGLGWAFQAWGGGFAYWDQAAGRPLPGMREALFGR